jgi:hypothetical protein
LGDFEGCHEYFLKAIRGIRVVANQATDSSPHQLPMFFYYIRPIWHVNLRWNESGIASIVARGERTLQKNPRPPPFAMFLTCLEAI